MFRRFKYLYYVDSSAAVYWLTRTFCYTSSCVSVRGEIDARLLKEIDAIP
jgi:hypothetical protein